MPLLEKKAGAPAGTITVTLSSGSYTFLDGSTTNIPDSAVALNLLSAFSWLQVQGGGVAFSIDPKETFVTARYRVSDQAFVDPDGVRLPDTTQRGSARIISLSTAGGFGGQMYSSTEMVTAEPFKVHRDCFGIEFIVSNALINGTGTSETYASGDLLVDGVIEYTAPDGTKAFIRATGVGSDESSVLLRGGRASTASMYAKVPFKAGMVGYIQLWVRGAAGGTVQIPGNDGLAWRPFDSQEGKNFLGGTNSSKLGTAVMASWGTSQANYTYRPLAVKALSWTGSAPVSVDVFGDSIASENYSWLNQYLRSQNVPYNNFAKSSEGFSHWPTGASVRMRGAGVADIAICALIRNNSYGGSAAEILKAKEFWRILRSMGYKKIIQTTSTPYTTGTWSTVGGQTAEPSGNSAAMNTYVRNLRGASDGPDVVWDIAPFVTAPGDIYRWDVDTGSLSLTDDGIHPNTRGINRIFARATSANLVTDLTLT